MQVVLRPPRVRLASALPPFLIRGQGWDSGKSVCFGGVGSGEVVGVRIKLLSSYWETTASPAQTLSSVWLARSLRPLPGQMAVVGCGLSQPLSPVLRVGRG